MAVYYVENIRRYYDTLLWVDERKQAELKQKSAPDSDDVNPCRRSTPGSLSFVPSVAGLIIAGEVIKDVSGYVPEYDD